MHSVTTSSCTAKPAPGDNRPVYRVISELERREAAGREWVYQLRQMAAGLEVDGQGARARELVRQAEVAEAEVAVLHQEHMRLLGHVRPARLRRAN